MITPSFGLTATERVLPKLALDFTTASLDSRITFTRALNTATRINSSGLIETVNADVARFDFDPVTKVCKGLLIEESRVNSFVYSEDFSQASWFRINISVSTDATTAPDGNTTADKWIPNNGATSCWMWQSPLTLATWTQSIFAKAAGFNVLQMNFFSTADGDRFAQFDLSNGTIGTTSSGVTAKMESYGNGWYRCIITYTMTGLVNQAAQPIRLPSGNTGDGVKGYYVWGAQLEAGAFATSYIPTTTTSLTRNADVARMTGTNFSSWFNASEGSVYVKADCYITNPSPTRRTIVFNKISGAAGYISFKIPRPSAATGMTIVDDAGAGAADLSGQAITANTPISVAGAFKQNSFAFSDRGVAVATDTLGDIPTGLDRMTIGYDNGSIWQNGHIQKIMFWPIRLTNAEIQAFSKG